MPTFAVLFGTIHVRFGGAPFDFQGGVEVEVRWRFFSLLKAAKQMGEVFVSLFVCLFYFSHTVGWSFFLPKLPVPDWFRGGSIFFFFFSFYSSGWWRFFLFCFLVSTVCVIFFFKKLPCPLDIKWCTSCLLQSLATFLQEFHRSCRWKQIMFSIHLTVQIFSYIDMKCSTLLPCWTEHSPVNSCKYFIDWNNKYSYLHIMFMYSDIK